MTTKELLEKLARLPAETTVRLSIQTEPGFYDVRGKFASGALQSVNYDARRQVVELEGR